MTDELLRATVTQRGVCVAPDDAVLVVQRASDAGWELPGGRLATDEPAVAGLHREIREETGLDPDVVTPVHTLTWRNDADDGRFAVYYYCRTRDRDVALSPEHGDARWTTPGEAKGILSTPQATAVDRALTAHRDAR